MNKLRDKLLMLLLFSALATEAIAQDLSFTAATSTKPYTSATSTSIKVDSKSYKSVGKFRARNIKIKDYSCVSIGKVTSIFTVCNEESEAIQIVGFSAGDPRKAFAKLMSPTLPIELAPAACQVFNITTGQKKRYLCGGLYDVVLRIEKETDGQKTKGSIAIAL